MCTIESLGVGGAYFGEGREFDPILLDSVSCNGNEQNLTECSHTTKHDCYHSEDVGILCRGTYLYCVGVEFNRVHVAAWPTSVHDHSEDMWVCYIVV